MYIFINLLVDFFILLFFCNFIECYWLKRAFVESVNVKRIFNGGKIWIPCQNEQIIQNRQGIPKYLFVKSQNLFKDPRYGTLYSTSVDRHTGDATEVLELKDIKENPENLIESLSTELLEDGISRFDFIDKLAHLGRSVYLESSTPSVFRELPHTLDLVKKFSSLDFECIGASQRDYFLVKPPVTVDYKLLEECSSSMYLSVHVDKEGFVYVDGISDSLVYKGILSLLIYLINGKKLDDLDFTSIKEHEYFKRIREFKVIGETSLDVIIKHIQKECQSQSSSEKKQKVECETRHSKSRKRVAVLLSGGVDSSVTLWLLKSRGFEVESFYLKVNDLSEGEGLCSSNDVEHAMEVCSNLGVTLHVLPFSKAYSDHVLSYFLEGYRIGEVPNPDVLCNTKIKFGEFFKKAMDWGFDYVASGHYASLVDDLVTKEQIDPNFDLSGCWPLENGKYQIKRLCLSKEKNKDQTYFLSGLSQRQLSRILFPLGNFTKNKVREMARMAGLITHNKKDSVGLCFLENVNVSEFLRNQLGKNEGQIVDYDTGEVIGQHEGLYNYTIGQRKNLNNYIFRKCKPNIIRYVVKKSLDNNTLYVTSNYNSSEFTSPEGPRCSFKVTDIFWNVPDYKSMLNKLKLVDENDPKDSFKFKVKLRHSPSFHECKINFTDSKNANVILNRPDTGISTGQFCVFYYDEYCIGAGKMISKEMQ